MVAAQYLKYPTAGLPKTADGKPNLSAPAPRAPDGKPDLSGLWLTDNFNCTRSPDPEALTCGAELPMGKEGINMGASLPGGLPYQPWLVPIVKERTATNAKDDPHVRCLPDTFLRAYSLPHMVKFVQTPGLLLMLNEMNAGYRQVFTDGRPLPKDPVPSWQVLLGQVGGRHARHRLNRVSRRPVDRLERKRDHVGRQGAGANRRPEYGHLEIGVTVDESKAYTKPWSVTLHQRLGINTELVDEICLENEQSFQRLR